MVKHWFLLIVPERAWAAALFGLVAWLALAAFGIVSMGPHVPEGSSGVVGTSLFFASMNVLAVLVCAYVLRRCAALVDELPLKAGGSSPDALKRELTHLPLKEVVGACATAVLAGTGHLMILYGTVADLPAAAFEPARIPTTVGTLLTWFVVVHMVWAFMRNAFVFSEVGARQLEIDLLQPRRLVPVGRAALMPTLHAGWCRWAGPR